MGIFRSEKMGLYTITIPKDSAWEIMDELGRINQVHFIDLNEREQVFTRTYSNFIKRCDEAERRIRFIEGEMRRFNIPLVKPIGVQAFINAIDQMIRVRKKAASTYFEEIENELEEKEIFLLEQTKKYQEMHDHYNYLLEYKFVISKALEILSQQADRTTTGESTSEGLIGFAYIAGVVNTIDQERFKKMIFRSTRGNVVPIFSVMKNPIEDFEGNSISKTIFVLIFKEGEQFRTKLNKICDSFSSERFDIPKNDVQAKQEEVVRKLTEASHLMQITKDEIKNTLNSLSTVGENNASRLEMHKWFVMKEKSLYYTLNMLRPENMLFRGLCWCPLAFIESIISKLQNMAQEKNIVGAQLTEIKEHDLTPPTYFRSTEFVEAFQGIVDTYGVPNYREANPGLFTIVSFPFLFGIMFGDACHGCILLVLAAVLCIKADYFRRKKSMIAAMLPARYLLLIMGVFAMYNGFMYNDFASVPMNWGDSCYYVSKEDIQLILHPPPPPPPPAGWKGEMTRHDDCIYAFGLDPIWGMSKNELQFENSFKMKLAVILGVTQMGIGVTMKMLNSIEFRRAEDFLFEFCPQILFLISYFGYMDLMIFVKWLKTWPASKGPSIISILVAIPLKLGDPGDIPLYSKDIQHAIGAAMFIVMMCMVPLMLVPKPYILRSKHARKMKALPPLMEGTDASEGEIITVAEDQSLRERSLSILQQKRGEFQMGEIFIHQTIETIEFVLGTISNTASYLRLWALSLAHAELSLVFFNYSMHIGLKLDSPNCGVFFICYFVLAGVTFGVLLCMDSLECFLHALRLHWVEFQNKFYHGAGYPFAPFAFSNTLKKVASDD